MADPNDPAPSAPRAGLTGDEGAAPSTRGLGVRPVPFNFQLGSWRIFSLARPLLVVEWTSTEGSPAAWPEIPPQADGVLVKGLPAAMEAALTKHSRPGQTHRRLRAYPRHLADVNTDFDAYLAKFSAKTRSTLKRKLRKFEELSGGALEWKVYSSPQELDGFLRLAHEVSTKTYQARLLRAGLPEDEAFRSRALALAAAGHARGYLLFHEGRPVSYLYLPIEGRSAVYAYLGYDPAVAGHSPGTVLHLLALQSLCADPAVDTLDFTEGAGEHKELFATRTEQCVDVLVLVTGSRAAWIALAHGAFMGCEGALARVLERLKIKRALKMAMRGSVRLGK